MECFFAVFIMVSFFTQRYCDKARSIEKNKKRKRMTGVVKEILSKCEKGN
jgi:hypothetical protein